ncbi:hypothetical protein U9M48_025136 [Paspalum notatum var. saurae]|uniref:U3 small nucleolar ribonucleoprotein protein IMP3 n=1 Tax=Paspalum notatum var. saurae TaxID=547442 RepID=A0AAQ3TN74_PASNO
MSWLQVAVGSGWRWAEGHGWMRVAGRGWSRQGAGGGRMGLAARGSWRELEEEPDTYNMGVIPTKKTLLKCENLSASAFCRRRLATVMVKLKFAEHLKEAVTYIEQEHVRVGPEMVTDPAFLVTRNMEDFITWVDSSKIKRKVMEYNDALDDYDAMF